MRNASSRTPHFFLFFFFFLYPESQQPHLLDFHHYNICLSFLCDQNRGTACLNFWVVFSRFLVLYQLYHFLTIMQPIRNFRLLLDTARLSSLNQSKLWGVCFIWHNQLKLHSQSCGPSQFEPESKQRLPL